MYFVLWVRMKEIKRLWVVFNPAELQQITGEGRRGEKERKMEKRAGKKEVVETRVFRSRCPGICL